MKTITAWLFLLPAAIIALVGDFTGDDIGGLLVGRPEVDAAMAEMAGTVRLLFGSDVAFAIPPLAEYTQEWIGMHNFLV
jgi:hypothetical protein